MNRVVAIGFGLVLSMGGVLTSRAAGQESAPSALPDAAAAAAGWSKSVCGHDDRSGDYVLRAESEAADRRPAP